MDRVVGVDVARGIAVLGMFTAHVGVAQSDAGTAWLVVADGRSAGLFAVLAGVSIALMTGGPQGPARAEQGLQRRRLAVRAALVAAIGYLLIGLGTPVNIILPSYAVMVLLVLPALGASHRGLAGGAVLVLLLAPPALVAYESLDLPTNEVTDLLATGTYPAIAWVGYVLAGMAVGRTDLGRMPTQVTLVVAGLVLTVVGYGAGTVGARLAPDVAAYLTIEPHSDTTPEMVGNAGVALGVVGLCLVLTRAGPIRRALSPVASTGAMPLSVYTAQVVAIALLGPAVVWFPQSNGTLLAFALVTLVLCALWGRLVGRGPLERLVRLLVLEAVPDPGSEPSRQDAGQWTR